MTEDPEPASPTLIEVLVAVYHSGYLELAEYFDIAATLGTGTEAIDVPLAEGVEAGLLIREESPDTGRVAFRLTREGHIRAEAGGD